jgi:hypothetical protein
MNINLRVQIAVLIYLVSITVLLYSNPRWFYTSENELKPFGTGKDKTVLPLWMAILLLAILSYYISHLIMLIV